MARKSTPAQPTVSGVRSAREIRDVMRAIIRSDEPAVVLSGLARSSNSFFSDACAVELSEGADPVFRASFPLPDDAAAADPPADLKTIATTFQAGSSHGHPAFAGVVVHSWIERDPTEYDAIIARLLVDLALAIVQNERMVQSTARAEDRAAKLAIDLITSRVEGEAIGILMTKHRATEEEAAGLLRRMSWTAQRQLDETSADVVRTADRAAVRSPAGRRRRLELSRAGAGRPNQASRTDAKLYFLGR